LQGKSQSGIISYRSNDWFDNRLRNKFLRALVFAYLEKEKEEAECEKYREQMDFSSLDNLSGNATAVEARSDL